MKKERSLLPSDDRFKKRAISVFAGGGTDYVTNFPFGFLETFPIQEAVEAYCRKERLTKEDVCTKEGLG